MPRTSPTSYPAYSVVAKSRIAMAANAAAINPPTKRAMPMILPAMTFLCGSPNPEVTDIDDKGSSQAPEPSPCVDFVDCHDRRQDWSHVDSNSPIANILELVVPVLAVGVLLAPIVISTLKGRWWAGVLGVGALVVAVITGFGLFGFPEPSDDFQQTLRFKLINLAGNVALYGGLGLAVFGVARRARPSSWWDRHKPTHPRS